MIIVSGHLYVEPSERDRYLAGCRDAILAARAADGCVDFHLSADPIEPARINVFEQWVSAEHVERFRGAGPSGELQAAIVGARVDQHEIAATTSLT